MKIISKVLGCSLFYAALAIAWVLTLIYALGLQALPRIEIWSVATIFATFTFICSLLCYYIKYNRY